MARQVSLMQVAGKLGNTTSYMLNGKPVTRTIGKVDKEKMKSAPQYEVTRQNQSDFSKASKAGQLFRKALLPITKGYTKHHYASDVVSLMLLALKADNVNPPDKRQIHVGLIDAKVQSAFKKLVFFSKRSTQFYGQVLTPAVDDNGQWILDLHIDKLWAKNQGPIQIRLGYLSIDFDTNQAEFKNDQLVIQANSLDACCDRYILPDPDLGQLPDVCLIYEVWREHVGHPSDLLYMGLLDVRLFSS